MYTDSILGIDIDDLNKKKKKFKIITGIGVCCLFFGLILFLLLPPLIHSGIIKNAIDMAALGEDN